MGGRILGSILLAVGAVTLMTGCAESSLDLQTGDCFTSNLFSDHPDGGTLDDVKIVDCAQPHNAEVISDFELDEPKYPGQKHLEASTGNLCVESFTEKVGTGPEKSKLEIRPLFPTAESWKKVQDRQVLCIVISEGNISRSVVTQK